MKNSFLVALLISIIAISPNAIAFGKEGHRIIGMVAETLLTAKARIRVHQITDDVTLDQLATYMDDHRPELGRRIAKWHYDNAPVCHKARVTQYCPHEDCASEQIAKLTLLLNSTSIDQQRQAIIFLSHLVGDIHQPLHAADNGDKGGNEIRVEGRGRYSKNLHSMWDSDFVKRQVRGMSEQAFAEEVLRQYADKVKAWESGSITDWMMESHRYAHVVAYGMLDGFNCNAQSSPSLVTITPEYREAAEQLVREQLVKAGARLAFILNSTYGSLQ